MRFSSRGLSWTEPVRIMTGSVLGRGAFAGSMLVFLLLLGRATGAGAAVLYDKQITGREVVIVTPDRHSGAVPLVVALHGCDQTPMEFLESTRLGALVDREQLVLALPRGRGGGDNPLGCWQWWEPENQRRTGPDPVHIAELTRSMDVRVDPERTYVLGFSSGAAMTMILATVYPDLFAAAGVHSGVGFAAAGNVTCALKAMETTPVDAETRGALGYLHQVFNRIVPTIIIHGDGDATVGPHHAEALVRETAQRNDFIDDGDGDNDSFDAEPDASFEDRGPCTLEDNASCHAHRVEHFEDHDGKVMLERVLIDELEHAWSGGAAGHRYSDPAGPDAAALFWAFFDKHRLDTEALQPAPPRRCEDWWAPPWWHYGWAGTMSFREYACDMNPWSMVWRHRIDGVAGPGSCP